ncbi:MAG: hypothetical protein ACYCSN_11090 [Acidobacteriaceae bacterium]
MQTSVSYTRNEGSTRMRPPADVLQMPEPGTRPMPQSGTAAGWPADRAADEAALAEQLDQLLTPDALAFLGALHRQFEPQRQHLLSRRRQRQAAFDSGCFPDFLYGTRHIRQMEWSVGRGIADPAEARFDLMVPAGAEHILAADGDSSGNEPDGFIADMEDYTSPLWRNCMQAHFALREAATAGDGAAASSKPRRSLWLRPRGLHAVEKHVRFGGAAISAWLFDTGLYCFHSARALLERGSAVSIHLPKLEGHEEARMCNDALSRMERHLTLPRGSLRTMVMIESVPAAFEMEEMLYELRDRCEGLAFNRCNYLNSFAKVFAQHPDHTLPEGRSISMDHPLLRSALDLMVHAAHKRGALALGPASLACEPARSIADDPASSARRVYLDNLRNARAGCDGALAAQASSIPVARAAFQEAFAERRKWAALSREQHRQKDSLISAQDLLSVPLGTLTAEGLARCVLVGVEHLSGWMEGNGTVMMDGRLETAASADLARMQVRQWLRSSARLEDGRMVTHRLVEDMVRDVLQQTEQRMGTVLFAQSAYRDAAQLFLGFCRETVPEQVFVLAYADIA